MSGDNSFSVQGSKIFTQFDIEGGGVDVRTKKTLRDRAVAWVVGNCIDIPVAGETKTITVDKEQFKAFLGRQYPDAQLSDTKSLLQAYERFIKEKVMKQGGSVLQGDSISGTRDQLLSFLWKLKAAGIHPPEGLFKEVANWRGELRFDKVSFMDRLLASANGESQPTKDPLPPEIEQFVKDFKAHRQAEKAKIIKITPLQMACRFGYAAGVDQLLAVQTDPSSLSASLHEAVSLARDIHYNRASVRPALKDLRHIINVLVIKGAELNRIIDEKTALQIACECGDEEIVRSMLRMTKQGEIIDGKDSQGNTLLHIAALSGSEAVVRLLIDWGAKVSAQNKQGNTPLHSAASPEVVAALVEALVEEGAENTANYNGDTALHVLALAAESNVQTARELMKFFPNDINARNKDGNAPLHLAAFSGNEGIVKLLLEEGKCDVNVKSNSSGDTPLHESVSPEMVCLLVEYGADINSTNNNEETPLLMACSSYSVYHHPKKAIQLINCGADINMTNDMGTSPLLREIRFEGKEGDDYLLIDLLIEKGASPDVQAKYQSDMVYYRRQADRVRERRELRSLLEQAHQKET